MTTQTKKVNVPAPKKTTVAKKVPVKKVAPKPVFSIIAVLNAEKFRSLPSVRYSKWSDGLMNQKGDQRLHYYTLGTVLEEAKVQMVKDGKPFDFKELIDEGKKRDGDISTSKAEFWTKWAEKEMAQFKSFFKDGKNPSSYVSAIIFELKKNGYIFK